MSLDDEERKLLAKTVSSCETLEKGLARAEATYRRKIIRANVAVALVAIVSVISGFIGWESWHTSRRVDREAEARAVELQEARVAGCIQSNIAVDAVREALPSVILASVPNPDGLDDGALVATLTPTQQEGYRRIQEKTAKKLVYRDCSAAGIAAFLKNPPKDPATG